MAYTETFNKADGPLGPNLTWTHPVPGFVVANNQAIIPGTASATSCRSRADHDTGSPDMYAELTIAPPTPFTHVYSSAEVCVRFDPTTNTCYGVRRQQRSGFGQSVVIFKSIDGVDTELVDTISVEFTAPETLRIEVEGSTIRAYINGTLTVSTTDTDITTGQRAGIGGYRTDNRDARYGIFLDDFTTGALGEPDPGPAYPGMIYRNIAGTLTEQSITLG